ncbi:hypothetical protein A0H81_11729 [Grifola frondosa]|uniref:Uncharacterized protein n=1 Tax=Grifola frondosa TaxID=5627 RepID=A0A1C7LU75_GRIFR|nr:hypothetical protein A0H81_11729 [Grifola frondosa]
MPATAISRSTIGVPNGRSYFCSGSGACPSPALSLVARVHDDFYGCTVPIPKNRRRTTNLRGPAHSALVPITQLSTLDDMWTSYSMICRVVVHAQPSVHQWRPLSILSSHISSLHADLR